MKQITCEMCGSNDLIKQDGVFICQNCGMKYSVEEVKKLMIEGTVDVQGTVQVDNTAFVQKYLMNARRAMEKEDWEEVEKYYNLVEQNDPTNIEAIFYSAYGKAKSSLTVNDIYKRQAIFKALTNSVSILDDNYDINNIDACNATLKKIVNDVIRMYGSNFVYTQTTNGYGVQSDNKSQTYQLFINVGSELASTLSDIITKIPQNKKDDALYVRKLQLVLVDFMTTTNSHLSNDSIIKNCSIAKNLLAKIREFDPSFAWDKDYDMRIEQANKRKKGGCAAGTVIFLFLVIVAVVIGVAIGLS